ncbi:MAG: hypothetical protein ABI461_20620, partial [Polyangiaceae bacterium]
MRLWLVGPLVLAPLFGAVPAFAQHARNLAKANELYVLIEGPKEAVLERQAHDTWVGVCRAPCDRPFLVGATYRIAGDGVRDSEPFVLEGKSGTTVTLHVSEAKHATGAALVQAGVIVSLLGGLTLLGGVFGSCSDSSGSAACANYSWLTYTGGAVAAVGVIGIVSGIVLMVQGAHASVVPTTTADAKPLAPSSSQPFSARFRFDAPPTRAPLAPTT